VYHPLHGKTRRPGLGRWMQMKTTASRHTAALAVSFLEQKRCGEPDAGPYCIAKASGLGRIAEFLGWILSFLYGGYQSIVAIETPGGDDDQQWLTFWVMFVGSMFFEQTFARVLLSAFQFYYEIKLVVIIWLLFFDGADYLYRKLRIKMSYWSPLFSNMLENNNERNAQNQLDSMIDIGKEVVTNKITLLEFDLQRDLEQRNAMPSFSSHTKIGSFWRYDYTDTKQGVNRTLAAEERLYQISKWMLGTQGMQELEYTLDKNSVAMLLERAAPVISFQPKFLNIHLIGTKPGSDGRLPVMDANGKTDCYIQFSLVCEASFSYVDCTRTSQRQGSFKNLAGMTPMQYLNLAVTSRIAYRTLEPEWNQILEMRLQGGKLETSGNYRNSDYRNKILLVEAWDADCGKWGIALDVFKVLAFSLPCAVAASYVLGVIDFLFNEKLTDEQWWWKMAIIALACFVILGFTLSYIMSVVMKADDEFIGNSAVPLEILTDQRAHALLLTLRNRRKKRGIIRTKLRLSEH